MHEHVFVEVSRRMVDKKSEITGKGDVGWQTDTYQYQVFSKCSCGKEKIDEATETTPEYEIEYSRDVR